MRVFRPLVEDVLSTANCSPEVAAAITDLVTTGVCPSCKKSGDGEPEFDYNDTYMGVPARINDGCSHSFHKAYKALQEAVGRS